MRERETPAGKTSGGALALRILFIVLALATAIPFIIGGAKLLCLGGSAYYLVAGIAYLATAVLFHFRKRAGLYLAIIVFLATCIWAFQEVGLFSYWELMARLVVPALILMFGLWAFAAGQPAARAPRRWSAAAGGVVFLGLVATFAAAFFPHGVIDNPGAMAQRPAPYASAQKSVESQDWRFIGRTAGGTRFAPLEQITPDNVKDLEVAWTYRTGRRLTGKAIGVDENTPMQIGSVLYSCTPENLITAIDADTGKALWKVDPHARTDEHVTCRGVGYYDVDQDASLAPQQKTAAAPSLCRQRIIATTVDARMMAFDAHSGQPCEGFGDGGSVDLQKGLGDTAGSRRYHPSSVPVIMGHLTVFGAWVRDITEDEPSGVLRAYDVRDGSLAWAWDVGNLEGHARGSDRYTLGTPNVWAIPTYDEELGVVYVATGNGPTDYWGGDRGEAKEKFGSSIVALEAATGRTKWVYQTVHHDVWDYDLPSQPVLYDMKNEQGEMVPVLIQTTKMGEIFVIDRRTGQPASAVVEKPVPTAPAAREEHLSPTQPFSVNMPSIGSEPLTEQSMWGISPFDQLDCRIKFKSAVYTGIYTPPSEQTYLEYPATMGGMNWGGISIDETTGIMYVNDIRMGMLMALKTREEARKYPVSLDEVPQWAGTMRPQVGGPYGGVRFDNFQSFLEVPCQKPPFGTLSAIDLNTKKLVWQVPMGTVQDTGPLGIKTHLPLPIGMPTLGGPTATASGLVFYAGTQDNDLRALDAKTGREIWKARLPVGATASPLIYQSPKTGKEYVVISAGGAAHSPDVGDYIIAYALPGH